MIQFSHFQINTTIEMGNSVEGCSLQNLGPFLKTKRHRESYPIPSMYGLFTYIWLIFYGKLVGKYTNPMDGMGM